jgi:predicted metal-binding membrane protein
LRCREARCGASTPAWSPSDFLSGPERVRSPCGVYRDVSRIGASDVSAPPRGGARAGASAARDLARPIFSGIDPSMVDPAARDEHPPTSLESALRYDRTPAAVLLVLVPLISWIWILVMARDMYGTMTGASAWMMTARWDVPHLLLLWAMWAVMMTGMMLPSASPLLLLYGFVARRSAQGTAARQLYALAAGYLMGLGRVQSRSNCASAIARGVPACFADDMMEITSPAVGGTLLLVAGVYQLTPIKYACLRTCQSPLGFLMSRWRSGSSGAFAMGLEHGAYCVGCCWALMLLLFAGGVMNLMVIATLTAFVAFEKLAPFGPHGARISGVC